MTGIGYLIKVHAVSYEINGHKITFDDPGYIGEAFDEAVKKYETKFTVSKGSKISGNDKKSFRETVRQWFNEGPKDYYSELFILTLKKISEMLKDGSIDLKKSLSAFKVSKNGIRLGDVPNGKKAFISPAILKNMEYYSQGTSFMKPTYGNNAMIDFDAFWFSILSLGFLIAYGGFRGDYYYILKPDVEAIFANNLLGLVFDILRILTDLSIKNRYILEAEELFEFSMAFDIIRDVNINLDNFMNNEVYPIRVYKVSFMGNVYLAKSVYDLSFSELIRFTNNYLKSLRSIPGWNKIFYLPPPKDDKNSKNKSKKSESKQEDSKIDMDLLYANGLTPLEQLLHIANRAIGSKKNPDNEMISFIMVKDIYRSVMSHNISVLEQSLYRILRKYVQYDASESKNIDKSLKATLYRFANIEHTKILLKSIL